MENSAWVLYRNDDVSGVYTSYRRAVQALMMRAALPIDSFLCEMGVDCYHDGAGDNWIIEEFDIDKI